MKSFIKNEKAVWECGGVGVHWLQGEEKQPWEQNLSHNLRVPGIFLPSWPTHSPLSKNTLSLLVELHILVREQETVKQQSSAHWDK